VRLRRAALPALLAANRTSIPVIAPVPASGATTAGSATPAGGASPVAVGAARPFRPRPRVVAPPSGEPRDRLMALTGALVAHDPPTLIGPVDASEAADALLAYLRRNGYLRPS
nr:hypothetical protein [Micromonospora sp. DSM 115978]